jgi:hypothetical protein
MRQRILPSALMDNPMPSSSTNHVRSHVTSSWSLKFIQTLSARQAIFFCSHVRSRRKICTQLIIQKGWSAPTDPPARCQSIGGATLEATFLQLVENRDVTQIANDIVDVMVS